MKGTSLLRWLAVLAFALAACETTTDVVLGRGAPPEDGGGVPAMGVHETSGEPRTGGTGGISAGGSSGGSGGFIDFPPSSPAGGQGGCATTERIEELILRQMYVLFDQSESMSAPLSPPGAGTWWQAGREAIARLVSDPVLVRTGYGVGLQLFPLGGMAPASCAADYSTPRVPIAALGENSAALLSAMQGRTPVAGRPLGPALAGAIAHVSTSAWGASLVLVIGSDVPLDCQPRDLAGVGAIVANGFLDAGVITYVIGLNQGTAGEALHAIAKAGRTDRATLIDGSANVADELYEAMRHILRPPSSCRILVPTPPSGEIPPLAYWSLKLRQWGSPIELDVPRVGSSTDCQGESTAGWYLTSPEGGAQPEVVFCPRTCAESQDAERLTLVFGCRPPTGS